MNQRILASTLALAFLAAAAGPLSAADKETRQMMADIRMLQEQSQELQNHLGALTEVLKALNTRIDQQTEASRKLFADQKVTIDAVSGDLRVVRERMDDNSVRLGSLTQEVDALRQTVLQINIAPAPQVAETPLDPGAAPSAAAAPPAAAPVRTPGIGSGLSPTAAFNQANADYFIGQYDLAVAGLEAYIRDFPRSELADDAQLNIGNSYMQLSRYDKAVEAYDLTIRTYPRGNVIPEAYYKKGVALTSLRRPDEARAALEYLIKNYPDSFEVTLAKQALDKLPSPPAPAPATRRP
jgi:TolA-binding protein